MESRNLVQDLDDETSPEPVTPTTLSGRTSPSAEGANDLPTPGIRKKKKKKKTKKSAGLPEAHTTNSSTSTPPPTHVLRISRNKHWRYISSYNGDWPTMQIEALQDLYALHHDPQTVEIAQTLLHLRNHPQKRRKSFETSSFGSPTPPESPLSLSTALPAMQLPSILQKPFPSAPPPVGRHIFDSLIQIRRLVDEASELSVRASSGMSSVELASMAPNGGVYGGVWGAAHAFGINPMGRPNGGRNAAMSSTRIHRLRSLAVQKLAQAYRADEIASSVMIMQGGDVFDDIAERVLKVNPNDSEARYVHFFHEKIPSRHLSHTTTTRALDELIALHPDRLEYFRTRGIVQCFRDEYPQSIKDFTHALKELRATRKAKFAHSERSTKPDPRASKSRKGAAPKNANHDTLPDTETTGRLVTAPPTNDDSLLDPLEPQLLFFRGTAYFLQAVYLIEAAILQLEGVTKSTSPDGPEIRLSGLRGGNYGGVEVGNLEGPLGSRQGQKQQAYTSALADATFKDYITSLVKKSIRDHEKFIAYFNSVDNPEARPPSDNAEDIPQQVQKALRLSELYKEKRPLELIGVRTAPVAIATTYHPLLVESLFAVLLCRLMLGDFPTIVHTFIRTATVVDGLDPSPIFAPARSVTQAEFTEVLNRLSCSWRNGIQPHSLMAQRGKSRLAIEPFSQVVAPSAASLPSPPVSRANSFHDTDNEHGAGSSSVHQSRNGNSSTNTLRYTASSSSSSAMMEEPLTQRRSDASKALDSARILLSAVLAHKRIRAESNAAAKGRSTKLGKVPTPTINLPLHGARVDVILAWLAAVHLPDLDSD